MKKVNSFKAIRYPSIVLSIVGVFTMLIPAHCQKAARSLLTEANQYFQNGEWPLALMTYKEYLESNPSDLVAQVHLGITFMKMNRQKESLKIWEHLMTEANQTPVLAYFYAARASHQLNRYADAEKFYRTYMEKAGPNAELGKVNYYLKQIGTAYTAGSADTRFLIENVGSTVNSVLDEFHPVYSPNIDGRFYFNTQINKTHSTIKPDRDITSSMKYAEVRDGTWKAIGPLDEDLINMNGPGPDYFLLDFSEDGQKVIFSKTSSNLSRKTLVKTFEDIHEEKWVSEWNNPVYNSTQGDRDLYTINDSAFLFSSRRLNGYGGYDIFVTFKRLGEWVVQNLGPEINSKFDEISPFLSNDGREIYFSSNSDKSIGGYDIFFATFDDDMEIWTQPRNMLPPLNSGMDDVGLRLSRNGEEALFTSNRPGGIGGYDIYQVYFDKAIQSQHQRHLPPNFYQVNAYRSFTSEDGNAPHPPDKPIYKLPVLYFGERPVVISPDVKAKLSEVVRFGKLYPHTGLILHVFTDTSPQNNFSLYHSVLTVKNVTSYISDHGISNERIEFRLYGNQYPRYTVLSEGDPAAIKGVKSPNQRVEFSFTGTSNLPVQTYVGGLEEEAEKSVLSPYDKLKKRTDQLYFRIQLAESGNLLKGADFIQKDDYMLTFLKKKELFGYFTEIFQHVEAASSALIKYKSLGFNQARLVAFLGDSRISGESITPETIERFPELKKYIIYQN